MTFTVHLLLLDDITGGEMKVTYRISDFAKSPFKILICKFIFIKYAGRNTSILSKQGDEPRTVPL